MKREVENSDKIVSRDEAPKDISCKCSDKAFGFLVFLVLNNGALKTVFDIEWAEPEIESGILVALSFAFYGTMHFIKTAKIPFIKKEKIPYVNRVVCYTFATIGLTLGVIVLLISSSLFMKDGIDSIYFNGMVRRESAGFIVSFLAIYLSSLALISLRINKEK